MNGEEITLYGDGTSSRDYTHISDIIQGIEKAMRKVKGFDIFNLGESSAISLSGLVSLLEEKTGEKAKIKYLPLQGGDVIRTFADISKAREMLGYNPLIGIDDGIESYIDWVRNTGKNKGK